MDDPGPKKANHRACGPCAAAKRSCDLHDAGQSVCSRCQSLGCADRCIVLSDRRTREHASKKLKTKKSGEQSLSEDTLRSAKKARVPAKPQADIFVEHVHVPFAPEALSQGAGVETKETAVAFWPHSFGGFDDSSKPLANDKASTISGSAANTELHEVLSRDSILTASRADALSRIASAPLLTGHMVGLSGGKPAHSLGKKPSGLGQKRGASIVFVQAPEHAGQAVTAERDARAARHVLALPVPTLHVHFDSLGRPVRGVANSAWGTLFERRGMGAAAVQLEVDVSLRRGVIPRTVHPDDAAMHEAVCMSTVARQAPYQSLTARFLVYTEPGMAATYVSAQETARMEYGSTGLPHRMTLLYAVRAQMDDGGNGGASFAGDGNLGYGMAVGRNASGGVSMFVPPRTGTAIGAPPPTGKGSVPAHHHADSPSSMPLPLPLPGYLTDERAQDFLAGHQRLGMGMGRSLSIGHPFGQAHGSTRSGMSPRQDFLSSTEPTSLILPGPDGRYGGFWLSGNGLDDRYGYGTVGYMTIGDEERGDGARVVRHAHGQETGGQLSEMGHVSHVGVGIHNGSIGSPLRAPLCPPMRAGIAPLETSMGLGSGGIEEVNVRLELRRSPSSVSSVSSVSAQYMFASSRGLTVGDREAHRPSHSQPASREGGPGAGTVPLGLQRGSSPKVGHSRASGGEGEGWGGWSAIDEARFLGDVEAL